MPSFRELWSGNYDRSSSAAADKTQRGRIEPEAVLAPRYPVVVQEPIGDIEKSAVRGLRPSDDMQVVGPRSIVKNPRSGRVTAKYLRYYADQNEFVRTAINRRKRQISQAEWHIIRTDDPEADPDKGVVDAVTELFKYVNPKRESFRSFFDQVLEDLLILDAGCFEKRKTVGGSILSMNVLDGASILPLEEWTGDDPNAIRYEQIVDNRIVNAWTNDELVYMMMNPRSTSVFGMSPVETLIKIIEAELYGEDYDWKMLKQASPAGIIDLGPGVPRKEVTAFRDEWQQDIAGKRGVGIFGGGDPNSKGIQFVKMQQSSQELQRRDYMKWLATKIAAVFEMDLGVFNLTETQHRTTAERQQNLTDEGHKSLATLVQEFITREVVWEFDPKHALRFSDLNARDDEAQSIMDERALRMGVIVPNEIRARDGLGDPLPYGETYFIAGKGPWTGMSSQGQRPDDEGAINPIEEPDGSPLLSNPLPPTEPGHPAMPHKTQPDPPPEPDAPIGKPGAKPAAGKSIEVAQKSAEDFR